MPLKVRVWAKIQLTFLDYLLQKLVVVRGGVQVYHPPLLIMAVRGRHTQFLPFVMFPIRNVSHSYCFPFVITPVFLGCALRALARIRAGRPYGAATFMLKSFNIGDEARASDFWCPFRFPGLQKWSLEFSTCSRTNR